MTESKSFGQSDKLISDFSQTVTINDVDYIFYVNYDGTTTDENDQYIISCIGNGSSFAKTIIDENDVINKIKNSLRQELGLKYDTILKTDGIDLKIIHPLFSQLNTSITLDKQKSNVTYDKLVDERLKELEKLQPKTYPITKDMLGHDIKLTDENTLSVEYVRNQFVNGNYDIPNLEHFYDVKYVNSKLPPVPSKNQFVVDGIFENKAIIKSNDILMLGDQKNWFSVFTRKVVHNAIGIVITNSNYINVYINKIDKCNVYKTARLTLGDIPSIKLPIKISDTLFKKNSTLIYEYIIQSGQSMVSFSNDTKGLIRYKDKDYKNVFVVFDQIIDNKLYLLNGYENKCLYF